MVLWTATPTSDLGALDECKLCHVLRTPLTSVFIPSPRLLSPVVAVVVAIVIIVTAAECILIRLCLMDVYEREFIKRECSNLLRGTSFYNFLRKGRGDGRRKEEARSC